MHGGLVIGTSVSRVSTGPRLWLALVLLIPLKVAQQLIGGTLLLAGIFRIGRGLTPLPYPKDGADLIQTDPYALVRHPMYGGGLVLALGWVLFVHGWLTLAYVAALFVFLDAKSRRGERWLSDTYSAYASYQQRVSKLIPIIRK